MKSSHLLALNLAAGTSLLGFLCQISRGGDYLWDNAGAAITNGAANTVLWNAANTWNPDGQTPNNLWANAILNMNNATPWAASLTAGTVLNLDLGTSAVTLNSFRQSNSGTVPTNPNNVTVNLVGGTGASLTLNQIIHSAGGTLQIAPTVPVSVATHPAYNPSGSLRVVNTDDSQTQLQGVLTVPGDVVKDGSGSVRFGTSGATFNNAVSGNFIVNGGTIEFAVGASGNTAGGAGRAVILNGPSATVNLRSTGAVDFVREFDLNAIIQTISADRSAGTGTGVTLSAGTLNAVRDGAYLSLSSGNSHNLQFDGINLGSRTLHIRNGLNNTANLDTTGRAFLGVLSGSGTLNVSGSGGNSTQGMTFDAASPQFSGTVNLFEGGNHIISASGALGSGNLVLGTSANTMPVAYPNVAVGSGGTPTTQGNPWSTLVKYNANNVTTGTVTVNGASQVNMGVVPGTGDRITLRPFGILQGSSAELAGFTAGGNLLLPASDAVIAHEVLGGSSPAALPATASHFHGLAANLEGSLTIGAGTPWKGISNDRFARNFGSGAAPSTLTVNGGDADTATIEATLAGLNGLTLSVLNGVGDSWASASGQKFTLGISGFGTPFGSLGAGNAPGGNVSFTQAAATSGLAANVDAIHVNAGNLSIGVAGGLGGVPVNVNAGGGLDIGGIVGNALDGPVNINAGGTLVLNDNTLLTGGAGNPITINTGGILHLTGVGTVPATILTASTQPITFAGSNHIVRVGVNNIASLDTSVPDLGAVWEIAATGTNTAANAFGTTIGATTLNTQTAGLSTDGGGFTTDGGGTRFLDAPLTIGNRGATFSATTNLSLAIVQPVTAGTGGGAGTAPIQIGSLTPVNYLTKTESVLLRTNNDDGIQLPHNASPQVLFLGGLKSGPVNHAAGSMYLDGPAGNTAIAGNLTMGPNTRLYLGDGGSIATGNGFTGAAPRRGDLTPLLLAGTVTTGSGNAIILGNYSRVEMGIDMDDPAYATSLVGGRAQLNQAFVITGDVNPDDRRSLWMNRSAGTTATPIDFNSITIRNNGHLAIQESNTDVRATVRLETDGRVSPFSPWDFKSLVNVDATGAPSTAPKTLTLGRGDTAIQGMSLFGAVDPGITIVNEYARFELRDGATLPAGFVFNDNANARALQSAQNTTNGGPGNGTDHTLSFFTGRDGLSSLTAGTFNINRGNAVGGYVNEAAAGPSLTNVIGSRVNLNASGAVLFADRATDAAITGIVRFADVAVNASDASFATRNGTDLEVGTLTVNQNAVIRVDGARTDSNTDNVGSVRIGTVAAGANDVHFQNGRTTITGGITADVLTVGGTSLELNPGGGTASHAVTDVRVNTMLAAKAGTTSFGSAILRSNPVGTMVAGLREGMIAGAGINVGTANPAANAATANAYDSSNLGIRLDPRIAQNNVSSGVAVDTAAGWSDNQTWVYTGQIYDADGVFTLAENVDDAVSIRINGQVVLFSRNSGAAGATGSNAEAANGYVPPGGGLAQAGLASQAPYDSWRTVTSTGSTDGLTAAYWQANSADAALNGQIADTRLANANEYGGTLNFGPSADGWYDIEIRINNGTGGAGSPNTLGFGTYFGLGLNANGSTSLLGTDYTKPIDNGTMNLFRTTTVAKGNVDIDGGATVAAGGVQTIGIVTFGRSGSGAAQLNLSGGNASDADALQVRGTGTAAGLDLAAAADTFIATRLNPAAGTTFTKTGAGRLTITGAADAGNTGDVLVTAGELRVNGSVLGAVTASGTGTLSGIGSVGSITVNAGGTLSPGTSPGILTSGNLVTTAGGTAVFEIGGLTAGNGSGFHDQLRVNGTVSLDGSLMISLVNAYEPAMNDEFILIDNDGTDLITGNFSLLPEGSTIPQPTGAEPLGFWWLRYGRGTDNNDFSITYVPEPGSTLTAAAAGMAFALRRRRRAA